MFQKLIVRWAVPFVCSALLITRYVYPDFLSILQKIQIDNFTIIAVAILIISLFYTYLSKVVTRASLYAFINIKLFNKRWVVIFVCLLLVTLRLSIPSVQVDTNIIWLVAIVALSFILPELKSIAPYIKRIKIGDMELELESLAKKVDKAQEVEEEKASTEIPKERSQKISSEVEEVLKEYSKNPKAAFLLLSAKLESSLREKLEEYGIHPKVLSAPRLVDIGVQNSILTDEFRAAFRDFWAIRNRIAHGAAYDIEDDDVLNLISLGTQLLKLLPTTDAQLRMIL
jgi:hypothetical protein